MEGVGKAAAALKKFSSKNFSRDIAQLEIFRDGWQILSVFLNSLSFKSLWPSFLISSLGAIAGVISISISNWIGSITPVDEFWYMFVIMQILFMWLSWKAYKLPNATFDSYAVSLDEYKSGKVLKFNGFLLTLLLTFYLPVHTKCAYQFSTAEASAAGTDNNFPWYLGILIIIEFTVIMPWILNKMIKRSLPKEEKYSSSGAELSPAEVQHRYMELLSESRNPWASLSQSFTRKWSSYKVFMIVIKFLIFVFVVVAGFVGSYGIWLPVLLMGILTFQTHVTSPFLDPTNEMVESASRWTSFLTAFAGGLSSVGTPQEVVGIIVFVVMALNLVTTVFGFLLRNPKVNLWWRRFKHNSAYDTLFDEPEAYNVSAKLMDLYWQPIWSQIFTDEKFAAPEEQKFGYLHTELSGPYLLNFKGTPEERFKEMQYIARICGPVPYKKSLAEFTTDYTAHLISQVERPDIYWNGYFTSVRIAPMPMCGVAVSDFSESGGGSPPESLGHEGITPVKGKKKKWPPLHFMTKPALDALIEAQSDPVAVQGRTLRLKFRGTNGQMFKHVIQRTVKVTKTRQVSDGQGGTRTETYQVNCDATFTMGRSSPSTSRDNSYKLLDAEGNEFEFNPSHGFNWGLDYHDGEGRDTEGDYHKNLHYFMNVTEFSVSLMTWAPTADLMSFMKKYAEEFQAGYVKSFNEQARYSAARAHEYTWKQNTLSYNFYNEVIFTEPSSLNLERLQMFLSTEKNESIRNLLNHGEEAQKFKAALIDSIIALNALGKRKDFGFWFLYWNSLWELNNDNGHWKTETTAPLMDTAESSCIACNYTPDKEAVKTVLTEAGLHKPMGSKFSLKYQGYISSEMIDNLYAALDTFGRGDAESVSAPPPQVADAPVELNAGGDDDQ